MTETDVLELAKEVLNYLDHGDTPYIKKVSWLAYEAAPALAAEVIRQAEEIEGLNIELRNKREAWDEYLKYGLDIAAMEYAQAEIAALRARVAELEGVKHDRD